MPRGEKGLQVLRNHSVEHRLAGIPGCVGGNRWRHTNPRRQQGVDGRTRSYPQLYCSFVQYASKMLCRRCGGNTGTHHHVAVATLWCPHGRVAKSAFEILIHYKLRKSDALQPGLLCGGDARTSAACQAAASPRWSAFAGARAAKRESRVRARGRSSSHATMRSILIAAAMATCCTWVFARPQYRVRRRPKARTPWESVPSTPARRL